MISRALIGHTGFVGSNLVRQAGFDALYNSSNVDAIRGRRFDLLVCSGVRAEKWIANANPDEDRQRIAALLDTLRTVTAGRVVLISTVDVFIEPLAVDEETQVVTDGLHAYGANRYWLEQELSGSFDTTVIRLPGLYGRGIKKNVIHDFIHDHQVDRIDSRGIFQFYPLDRLSSDIETALENDLPVVHLPTEPVSVADVAAVAFGRSFENHVVPTPARYDIRTRHARLFGGRGHYLEDRDRELAGIRSFVAAERQRLAGLQDAS